LNSLISLSKQGFSGQWGKQACSDCRQQYACVGCSWLGRKAYRKFLLERVLHKKVALTQRMIQGSLKHEVLARESGAREYKLDNRYFWNKLHDERKVRLAEGHICSYVLGLNGHPDQMNIQIKKNPLRIFFDIRERKGRWYKTYWLQAYAYGLIVADPRFMLGEEQFYDKLGLDFASVNVDVTLEPYYSEKYAKTVTLIRNGKLVKPELKFGVQKQRRRYLDLIDGGKAETLPMCEPCNPEDHCGFMEYCKESLLLKQVTLKSFGVKQK